MLARPLSSSARCNRLPVAVLLLVVCAGSASAARRHPILTQFERAQQMRDALEADPETERTRGDYEQVLAAYRSVYHSNPADPKAQQSINTVAALLAEQGRIFHSQKTLHDAIAQCEFLRSQYPGGPFAASALLTEANISLHDLGDRAAAKAAYEQLLRESPGDPLAAQARAGLKEIRHPNRHDSAPDNASRSAEAASAATPLGRRRSGGGGRSTVLEAARNSQAAQTASSEPQTVTRATPAPGHDNELTRLDPSTAPSPSAGASSALKSDAPASLGTAAAINASKADATTAAGQPVLTGATRVAAQQHHGRLPLVTNVRHWSTPVYTRVAIDLQDQVEYEAARVPNPDRIYFDLHGAKVAPELIGHSVDVTDDGFLERIRVAQFSNDVTRIVLDVSHVSEYSAFFLPNPWRLIIDIHGSDNHGGRPASRPASPPVEIALTPAPQPGADRPSATGATQAGAQSPAAATRALHDIAALGARPDQVKATRKPTTQPIAASVPANASGHPPSTVTVEDGPEDSAPANTAGPEVASVPAPSPLTSRQKKPRPSAHSDNTALGDTLDAPSGGRLGDIAHEAVPVDGQRSLTRALGLKIGRIVVDAGHGGHDSGTLGPGGIEEKEVVLNVALRLGKLLRQRLGAEVIFTRDDDTFIPLETRTAIANKAQADLFISVHANSSPDPTARGVETYYLNFTTSPDALEVAARENAVSDQSVHELSGLVKKITLKDKIDESREFASDVEKSLYAGLEQGNPGLRDRGVKKAPFVVLIGANMPSILAEISFLTNPNDASQLRDPAYRQRIAESLYRGVARYVSGLSGLRVAQNGSRSATD